MTLKVNTPTGAALNYTVSLRLSLGIYLKKKKEKKFTPLPQVISRAVPLLELDLERTKFDVSRPQRRRTSGY